MVNNRHFKNTKAAEDLGEVPKDEEVRNMYKTKRRIEDVEDKPDDY